MSKLPKYRQLINPNLPKPFAVGLSLAIVVTSLLGLYTIVSAQTEALKDCPNEEPLLIPNVTKKLIRIGPTRINKCIKPDLIFIHATNGGTLQSNWDYFDSGSEGNGTNAQFIVGTDGTIFQTVELYQDITEYAVTNSPYNHRSIGIEMVHNDIQFANKSASPTAQYNATLQLVSYLMSQYNIPLGSNEADWVSDTGFSTNPNFSSGVYGHYQIGPPPVHQDPGKEFFTAFRNDLRTTAGDSTSPATGGGGGRIVPYDAYARPYSWPVTGTIRQDYGFTEQAQSLGQRFPGMYPLGDPNVIFSTENHVEPPLDPAKAKYINPNIDIEPTDGSASARAVYATQAGWLTFAGWAGPQKGYTIQIESDVEGDGQADLATRYMRLQPPQNGFFAPDIPEYYPETLPPENPTSQNPRQLEQQAPPLYTIEAENMQPDNEDQAAIDSTDSLASAGASMHFTGNTGIRQPVEHKADQLMIKAKGTTCPLMGDPTIAVMINNQLVDTININSNIWQTYTINVNDLDGSRHILSLHLNNYFSAGLCSRKAWVDTISYNITNPNTPTTKLTDSTKVEAEDLNDVTEGDDKTQIVIDRNASNNAYVAFESNSKIEGNVEIADANYFAIRARADLCGPEPAKLSIKLDDQELLNLGVNQTGWVEYTAVIGSGTPATSDNSTDQDDTDNQTLDPTDPRVQGAKTETGSVLQASDEQTTRKLSIEFTNDEFKPLQCDRNAYVDMVKFLNYETVQATYNPASLIGKTKYVAFNQLIGYVSSSRGTDAEWLEASKSIQIDMDTQPDELEQLKQRFAGGIPNANQTYLSYRIMYNNPNLTTFPPPTETDTFINAKVDNPYIVETDDNKIAGNLKTVFEQPDSPMFFFCALRQRGNNVKCIYEPNPY